MNNNALVDILSFRTISRKQHIEKFNSSKKTKNSSNFSDMLNRKINENSNADRKVEGLYEKGKHVEDEVINEEKNKLEQTKGPNKAGKNEEKKKVKNKEINIESLPKETTDNTSKESIEIIQLIDSLDKLVEKLNKELVEANIKATDEGTNGKNEVLTDMSSLKQLLDNIIQYIEEDKALDLKHLNEIVSNIEKVLDKLPLMENKEFLSSSFETLINEIKKSTIIIGEDKSNKAVAVNIGNNHTDKELNNLIDNKDIKENIALQEEVVVETKEERKFEKEAKVDFGRLQVNDNKDKNNIYPLNKEMNNEFLTENNGFKQHFVQTKQELQEKTQLESKNFIQLNKDDIVNKLVEKAKLDVTGQQSEIKLKLKPEILGEMTLKIAIEKGIITAKALVESYQVKELIESNLDQLKDELKEHGMDIKGFDVSVGKDHSFSENRYRNEYNKTINKKLRIKLNSIDTDSLYLQNSINLIENNRDSSYYGGIDLMA
jgi:flagellar hook-length control protein FliK